DGAVGITGGGGVQRDRAPGRGRVGRGREGGGRGLVLDRHGYRRGRRAAAVVGDPEADRALAGGRVGTAGGGTDAAVGLVAAVAVEVPLVFGDGAVGVAGGTGVE